MSERPAAGPRAAIFKQWVYDVVAVGDGPNDYLMIHWKMRLGEIRLQHFYRELINSSGHALTVIGLETNRLDRWLWANAFSSVGP